MDLQRGQGDSSKSFIRSSNDRRWTRPGAGRLLAICLPWQRRPLKNFGKRIKPRAPATCENPRIMNEREKILGRITEALSLAAPLPGHGVGVRPSDLVAAARDIRQWLPLV